MIRSVHKKSKDIWVDPSVYFSTVNPNTRSQADKDCLVIYVCSNAEGGCFINEERLMRLLRCMKIYGISNLTSGSLVSPLNGSGGRNNQSFVTFGRQANNSGKHSEHRDANFSRIKFSSFIGASYCKRVESQTGDVTPASVNLNRKKNGHQRSLSDYEVTPTDKQSPGNHIVEVNIVQFSYKGVLFELGDAVSLSQFIQIAPDRRINDQEYYLRLLKLLLRMSMPLLSTGDMDHNHKWKEFITHKTSDVITILQKQGDGSGHQILEAFKHFLIQSSFAENMEQPIRIGSPQGNLMRSITSFEDICESLQKTIKKPPHTTVPINETMEALLIGLFTSISNDSSKKESFYGEAGLHKYSQLDYNSLLELTIQFLSNEFTKDFGTEITSEELMTRLKGVKDSKGIDSFKHSGDIKLLHSVIFPKSTDSSPKSRVRSKIPQIVVEKAPSQPDTPKKTVRSRSIKRHTEGVTTLNALDLPKTPKIERIPSGSGDQISSSKLSKYDEISSLGRSRNNTLGCDSPEMPAFKLRRDHAELSQRDSQSNFDSHDEEKMYASFFEDNWHVLKNDLKDLLLNKVSNTDQGKDQIFRKQIYSLIKNENLLVIGNTTHLLFNRIDEKKFNVLVKRQTRQSNHQLDGKVTKSNKEFHYTVFKVLIGYLKNAEIDFYLLNMKTLFLHEDKFLLGSYEVTVNQLLKNSYSEYHLDMCLKELERNLLILTSALKYKLGVNLLEDDLRAEKTQAYKDDEAIIKEFDGLLSEVEAQGLRRTIYFNSSGLLFNLHCRLRRGEFEKSEMLMTLRTYASMYGHRKV
jgi:hypothetical protein